MMRHPAPPPVGSRMSTMFGTAVWSGWKRPPAAHKALPQTPAQIGAFSATRRRQNHFRAIFSTRSPGAAACWKRRPTDDRQIGGFSAPYSPACQTRRQPQIRLGGAVERGRGRQLASAMRDPETQSPESAISSKRQKTSPVGCAPNRRGIQRVWTGPWARPVDPGPPPAANRSRRACTRWLLCTSAAMHRPSRPPRCAAAATPFCTRGQ